MLDLGRPHDARTILEQLLSMPELETGLRLETLRTLGQIEFHAGRYRRARRCLRQAMELAPGNAALYEQLALTIEADGTTPLATGLKAIHRAVKIDRLEPRFGAVLGRIALAMGKRKLARKAFRHVARLNPTSVSVLETLVTGFMQLELPQEATKLLMLARAEMANSPALRSLWDRLRFELVRSNQELNAAEPKLLPFPAGQTSAKPARITGEGIVRVDRASTAGFPHILRRINLNH